MGFVWVHADSFLHSVAMASRSSPFHSCNYQSYIPYVTSALAFALAFACLVQISKGLFSTALAGALNSQSLLILPAEA